MAPQDPFTATPADVGADLASEARVGACVLHALAVLRRQPAGLLTDIDGTVSEMAPAPDLSVIEASALHALDALALRLAIVGVVTGRAAHDALRLTNRPDLLHVGNHGYERILGITHSFAHGVEPYLSGVSEAAESVRSAQLFDRDLKGAVIENKRYTASFHYRLCDDPERAQAAIRRIIEPIAIAALLNMSDGKMVIELKPPLPVNKGTAIRELINEHGLKGLIFFGDDTTDIDGFNTIHDLAGVAGFQGLAVAIVGLDANPLVAAAADLRLHGVRECTEVLARLATLLNPGPSGLPTEIIE